jgi:cysteinyl-tRNA synthetase
MWPFTSSSALKKSSAPVFFTNTLSGKKEVFVPIAPGFATMYSCGPTVYSEAHIGNMRTYVMADGIARVLKSAGYRVRRVLNITDVGHLVNDGDTGEDKMEIGSKAEGIRASDIAHKYAARAIADMELLGMDTKDMLFPFATHYIQEQIAFIEALEKKGFTYRIKDGVYFNTSKFAGYGKLGRGKEQRIIEGSAETLAARIPQSFARIEKNDQKIHEADFALWKFSPLGIVRQQEWPSPWGRGFPGWHIECSAMSKALLGKEIDIHTGGIDLISIHHNNEIAQSEGVFGKAFVRYWMHSAFLNIGEDKISKSLGNSVTVSEVIARGYSPLTIRYFFLQAHYRSPLSFTWESMHASSEALTRLWRLAKEIKEESKEIPANSEIRDRVITHLRDDLGTPQALALLWETVRDEDLSPKVKWGVILAVDEVFGLSLSNPPSTRGALTPEDLPEAIAHLAREREAARTNKDFARSDELRIHIENSGYAVEDSAGGQLIRRVR